MPLSRFFRERKAFFLKSALLAGCLAISVTWFQSRFLIAFDKQTDPCFEWRLFLVDTSRTVPQKGELIAYSALNMAPAVEDGQLAVKMAVGLPGDEISVSEHETRINQQPRFRSGLGLLYKLPGKAVADFERTFSVQDGQYFGMGTTPSSYDSRYWGTISDSQIVGIAHPIW